MNRSEGLASALRQAADAMPVGAAPVDAVLRTGRAIRRRRRTVRSVVSVAVLVPLCGAAGLLLGPAARDTGRAVPVLSAPARPAATAPGPAVVVRGVGQPYGFGGGRELTLTAQGAEISAPAAGDGTPWTARVDQVPPGEITAAVLGDGPSALVVGLYRGAGPAARVTVDLGGRSTEAQVVTLAGAPGWCAFVADVGENGRVPRVAVLAADGTVLARLAKQG
ncbi:hypothetical protein GCM10018781_15990 [Kitasatospora indigofera]|uniref:Uncharacterized protein n=1 Tax=Kitasatospora indigofera TaxID=67307 RepID=A0A919FG38_9ACTN|nr:hypothetical protein [Kitasatospora indigofera]GHH64608.1 hypothetical protein GCM10018781_15990 [Kitasatospora indigofera]